MATNLPTDSKQSYPLPGRASGLDWWADCCLVSLGKHFAMQVSKLTDNRGLVAAFQAFQKGLGPYLATRLLLGYGSRITF